MEKERELLLFGCGSNISGETGLRRSKETTRLHQIPIPNDLGYIKQVECGVSTSFIVTTEGDVYQWGCLTEKDKPTPKPTKIKYFVENNIRILSISCRNAHVAALSDCGHVYIWGNNEMHHFPGPDFVFAEDPFKLHLPKPAKSVKCGGFFTLVLLEDGTIMSFGINHDNICGIESDESVITDPVLIPKDKFNNKRIRQIACGWSHAAALSEDGILYTWGRASLGRLGHDNGTSISPVDLCMKIRSPISMITCSDTGTFALCINGELRATGWNKNGENGYGNANNGKKVSKFMRKVAMFTNINHISIAAGTDHTIILCGDGVAYGCGSNENNRLGLNVNEDITTPTAIQLPCYITAVGVGYKHSLFAGVIITDKLDEE